jgi:SAM-dependent methyltransferase
MYQAMHEILNEGKIGKYVLQKFEINDSNRSFGNPIPYGKYIRLHDGMDCIMSNTYMEERTNREFVLKANGDVFIAGLGIGLIVLPVQDKVEVKSITILEKSPEVIELVGNQLLLNNKVKIIQGDVFEYEFPKGTKFDTIYFDIWNYVNSDVYKEMKALKNKYRKYRLSSKENPDVYMKCWAEYEAKTDRRLY